MIKGASLVSMWLERYLSLSHISPQGGEMDLCITTRVGATKGLSYVVRRRNGWAGFGAAGRQQATGTQQTKGATTLHSVVYER